MEKKAVNLVPVKWRLSIYAPTLSNSLAVWDRVQNNPNLISPFHTLVYLFNNSTFSQGQNLEAFQRRQNKILYRIGHFFAPEDPFTLQDYHS